MATSAPPAGGLFEQEFDLRYYADVLWRGRTLVLATAVTGIALGLLSGFLQTPEYRAATMLQIDPPKPAFMSVGDALMGGGNYWQNADFYNTEFRILRGKDVAERAVERLRKEGQFKDQADAASVLQAQLSVDPIPETRLVLVQVTHRDPKLAAQWANTLAEVYIEKAVSVRMADAKGALEWLHGRLEATQVTMHDAQEKLLKSYQRQDLFVPEGSVSAVSTSITKLNEDAISAQTRLIELTAAVKQITEMRERGQSLDAVPQVAADSQVSAYNQQLASLNLELARAREKFKEAHPEVQKIQAQIAQVSQAREGRALQVELGLKAEQRQLAGRVSELRSAIEGQKAQAASQGQKSGELEALKKEADSAKGLYEVLLQKANENEIAASTGSSKIAIVERAAVPADPVRPNKRNIALLGLALGIVAGVGLVAGREYFDNTLKDPDEIERYLRVHLLAAVPRQDEASQHLVTEAYQNLRTALIFARKDELGHVVLVTGTAPQEGKTTTLVNLAKLLANSGERVIVLDCDLRRAQLHHRLGLPREPGLTDIFVRHENVDALIRPTSTPNLFALTAGPLPPYPPALLARKQVPELLDRLRKSFEWILVDSPPLASVTDALLLTRYADSTIAVVQHNKVDKRLVKRCLSNLQRAAPNLLGVVLNAVDVKSQGYHYYYYQQTDETGERKPGPRPATKAS
jgi:polysaccharide biosynthesis transport protein